MNNTFSLEHLSRTGSLHSNFITRQYKLDSMVRLMKIKSVSPKMQQNQTAKELGYSSSTLQRYRNDINMLSPYGIPHNDTNKKKQKSSNTNLDDISNREHDVQRHQMTSNDVGKPATNTEPTVERIFKRGNKYILKAVSVQGYIEINE